MDLSDPTRAVVSTLDGAVLALLATSGRPLTVGEVAAAAVRGSEIGVRRSLGRLVGQGLVRATLMGRNQVHELNREHLAAPIAVALANLRAELWARLRTELTSWRVRPLYACVFGSAARGDGDDASDIDLLLVHPRFPGETEPSRADRGLLEAMGDAIGDDVASSGERDVVDEWHSQQDRLRQKVENWTGNPLQIVDVSFHEWRHPSDSVRRLLQGIADESIELVKSPSARSWLPAAQRLG